MVHPGAVIVWNLIRPSFAAMAVPMLALWLYTIACMAQEVSAFRRSFSARYPGRFREWTGSRRIGHSAAGPRPVRCGGPGAVGALAPAPKRAAALPLRVFAGFVLLFAALLIRTVLLGPYEST